jgi:hypothetical protein
MLKLLALLLIPAAVAAPSPQVTGTSGTCRKAPGQIFSACPTGYICDFRTAFCSGTTTDMTCVFSGVCVGNDQQPKPCGSSPVGYQSCEEGYGCDIQRSLCGMGTPRTCYYRGVCVQACSGPDDRSCPRGTSCTSDAYCGGGGGTCPSYICV